LIHPVKLKSNDPDDRDRTQNDSQPDMVVFHEGKIKQIGLTVDFFPLGNKKKLILRPASLYGSFLKC